MAKDKKKQGRPLKVGAKKDKRIAGYLTEEEFDLFKDMALSKDMNMATLVRLSILDILNKKD